MITDSLILTSTTTTTTAGDFMIMNICRRCGGSHDIERCPQVKAIEYDEQHRIKRIEFLTPGDYVPPMNIEPFPKPPYDITIATTDVSTDGTTDTGEFHRTWTFT